MPGPGPRGPCETYRAPCSSIPDSRISARNPRKTGKSRAARRTRTRQPGTRSTRDGLLCGEIASAAGEQRPSILDPPASILDPRPLPNEIRRTILDPRANHRPSARAPASSSTRDGLLFVKSGCKHRDPRPSRPSSRATGPESGANFQQKIANWRKSASFAKIFLGSRTGSRPLLNEIRRTDRRIDPRGRDPSPGPRDIGSDSAGSGPATGAQIERPAALSPKVKVHVFHKQSGKKQYDVFHVKHCLIIRQMLKACSLSNKRAYSCILFVHFRVPRWMYLIRS